MVFITLSNKTTQPWLQLLNSCFSGTVFVTFLRTVVKTAVSEVHKLLGTGGVPALTLLFWRWLHDGLFGLYGTERLDESE